MIKIKPFGKYILSCVIAGIILTACNDHFVDNSNFGNIVINLSHQDGRTIIPTLAPFEDYVISFESKDGKTPPASITIEGTQASIPLDSGRWVITAVGRTTIDGVKKVIAEGNSGEIDIVQNVVTPINISLYAKLEGDDGAISYNKTDFLSWTAAANANLSLISLEDDEVKATANLLSSVDSENPGYFSLEPGFYLMVIKAVAVQAGQDSAVRGANITEVIHVYSNTETVIPFTTDDFTFVPSYSITVTPTSNGLITVLPAGTAPEGSTVTLSVQSIAGYGLVSLLAQYGNNENLLLTLIELDSYAFTMPAGNVTITGAFGIPSEFTEDFESTLSSLWQRSSNVILTTQAVEAPEDDNFGNETQFVKLPAITSPGAFLERRVNPTVTSALTFSFKTDIRTDAGQIFRIYINDVEMGSWDGLGSPWRTETIPLPPGEQTIRFEVSATGSYFPNRLNAVFIDNISLIPDITDSVVLYPQSQLDTYVGVPENERIQFRAIALRSDGSVRDNVSGFVYSGTGVNSSTGVFTPQTAGNVTVTVSLDGKTASNNVTVHAANYLRQPYYYPGTGKTYNGFSGTEGNRTNPSVTITYPSESTFSADGFFTMEGTVNNPSAYNYAAIRLMKDSDQTNLRTTYYVRDSFKMRIWLRFGPGEYTIQVWHLSDTSGVTFNLNGDGDFIGSVSFSNSITFNVTNTRNDDLSLDSTIPDKRFIYPSYVVQSDDFAVTNLAAELTYGLTDDTAKIKAIHDYIVTNTVYDDDSLEANQRKKQDALTVLGTRYFVDSQYNPGGHFLAVCEGYANLFSALTRAAGFETRYISGMGHGWNHIYVNGGWKFIDVTWNDPVRSNAPAGTVDFGPSYVRYLYFLLDSLDGNNNSHTGWQVNQGRSMIGGIVLPSQRGVPDGWY